MKKMLIILTMLITSLVMMSCEVIDDTVLNSELIEDMQDIESYGVYVDGNFLTNIEEGDIAEYNGTMYCVYYPDSPFKQWTCFEAERVELRAN